MVAQQVGITQQLLQVLTDLLNAFGAWFTFEAAAGVSNEILQAIGFSKVSACILMNVLLDNLGARQFLDVKASVPRRIFRLTVYIGRLAGLFLIGRHWLR